MKVPLERVDKLSFTLGMINAFAEMVATGVKPLAFSPPIAPGDYDGIAPGSKAIVAEFGIHTKLERNLLETALFPSDATKDRWVILYYSDPSVLQEYLALKEEKQRLEASGEYRGEALTGIARSLGQLLGYPEAVINERLSEANVAF